VNPLKPLKSDLRGVAIFAKACFGHLKEIQENPELKNTLQQLLLNAKKDEKLFYQLLFAKFLSSGGTARDDAEIEGYGYKQYRSGVRFILGFVEGVLQLNEPKSNYLRSLAENPGNVALAK
jgi:hypothetical protein